MDFYPEQNIDPAIEVKNLQEENKRLRIDIASLQASNRSLSDISKEERHRIAELQQRISDFETKVKQHERLQADHSKQQKNLETLRTSLAASEKRIQDLQRQVQNTEELLQMRDDLSEKQRCLFEEVENEKRALESRIQALEDNKEMTEKLATLTSKCQEQETLIHALQSQLESYKVPSECTKIKVEPPQLSASFPQDVKKEDTFGPELPPELMSSGMGKQESEVAMDGPQIFPTIAESVEDIRDKQQQTGATSTEQDNQSPDIQIKDLKTLLSYREDLILKMYEEMRKKTEAFEQMKSEREALNGQVQTAKKDVEKYREQVEQVQRQFDDFRYECRHKHGSSSSRGGGRDDRGSAAAAELSRYRRKYEEERDKRKRAEKDADELEEKLNQLKAKLGRLPPNTTVVTLPNPLNPTGPVPPSPASAPPRGGPSAAVGPRVASPSSPSPAAAPAAVGPTSKQANDVAERARILELQATIRELRTENDAKRSELFDLRSRLDEKSTQIDQLTAQLKVKDKTSGEMSQRLNTVQQGLDTSQRELRQVSSKCDAMQSEMQLREGDVLSMKTSNHYLVQCVHHLRRRLKALTGHDVQLRDELGLFTEQDPNVYPPQPMCNEFGGSGLGEPEAKRMRSDDPMIPSY